MNANFCQTITALNPEFKNRTGLSTLQVNVGNLCNQRCVHCHVGAGPDGKNIMSKEVMDSIVAFLKKNKNLDLDITGGCVELNPEIKNFITKARPFVKNIIARTNLTILVESKTDMIDFYKKNKVKLIASMPCYTKENVEKQRGKGVYDKSLEALKKLNTAGYGKNKDLELDLVYNPGGAVLPGEQSSLERDYKKQLSENHGIVFNRLFTITNAPINRFEQYLKSNGEYEKYMDLLVSSFNKETAGNIMCRTLLSVGWSGKVYDCDFNQALELPLRDKRGVAINICDLDAVLLRGKEIIFANHCYCCTAGAGSSCTGTLCH